MSLRHAAAMTAVVWFLVFPQIRNDTRAKSLSLETGMPLSKWRKSGQFGSLAECQQRLARFRKDSNAAYQREMEHARAHSDDPDEPGYVRFRTATKNQAAAAMCVADDDPRLKKSY